MKNPSSSEDRRLRRDAREIFFAALERCSPDRLISSTLSFQGCFLTGPDFRIEIPPRKRILVLAYGKASPAMGSAFLKLISPRQAEGIAVRPTAPAIGVRGLRDVRASHPVPDARSFRAGRLLRERVQHAGSSDLIVHLISGGSSALVAAPLPGLVTIREKVLLHRLLVGSGLGIREVNSVRKHFSAIKGGRLLLQSPRASHLSLILSDVPPGLPDLVGGGPTLPDPSTWDQCLSFLKQSGVLRELPEGLRNRLARGGLPETPKPGDTRFRRHRYSVVGSGDHLVAEASKRATELGYRVGLLPSSVEESAEKALGRLLQLRASHRRDGGPICIVAGGEVRARFGGGKGRGGRAQDLAAAASVRLRGEADCLFLAAGSDGVDGNSPAAGAIVDGTTWARARRAGLDPEALRRAGDTYRLFRELGDSLITGATGNNLRDLYLLLERPRRASALRSDSKDRRG